MSRIDDYHYYHGAALALIAEHGAFTSINKFPAIKSRGVYLLNHNTALYVKHSTMDGLRWRFTFAPEHQVDIRKIFDNFGERTFVVLVCNNLICLLTYGEYASCLDENFKEDEWLEVWRPEGGGFRVRGAVDELDHIVALNRFPNQLFV
jgi:hypothetical protein